MRGRTVLPLAAAIGACAAAPIEVTVREVARSAQCNASVGAQQLEVLPGAAAVGAWQSARGVRLVAMDEVRDAPHAVVQMGRRPTAGYGISVSPVATIKDHTLVITADFTGPEPDAMVAQVLTSPCVLIEVPPGDYRGIEVRDVEGAPLGNRPVQAGVPAT